MHLAWGLTYSWDGQRIHNNIRGMGRAFRPAGTVRACPLQHAQAGRDPGAGGPPTWPWPRDRRCGVRGVILSLLVHCRCWRWEWLRGKEWRSEVVKFRLCDCWKKWSMDGMGLNLVQVTRYQTLYSCRDVVYVFLNLYFKNVITYTPDSSLLSVSPWIWPVRKSWSWRCVSGGICCTWRHRWRWRQRTPCRMCVRIRRLLWRRCLRRCHCHFLFRRLRFEWRVCHSRGPQGGLTHYRLKCGIQCFTQFLHFALFVENIETAAILLLMD